MTGVAVVAALAAAATFGISSVADQRSTKRVETRRALSPRILADLVRQPLWLTAIAANVAGFALQVVALSSGSLALVQPILVCDLVCTVLIARFLAHRENRPRPPARQVFIGVAATTLGVAGFLAIGQPSGGRTHVRLGLLPPLVAVLVIVVGGCLVVAARNQSIRPLALALACGVNYGAAAFVVKLVTSEFGGGAVQVFTNWPIYVFAVVGPAGFILNQDAFQQGALIAPVQAIVTAADPVVSIALGIVWLDVRLRGGPAAITGEVVALLLMTVGIVIIAHASAKLDMPGRPAKGDLCRIPDAAAPRMPHPRMPPPLVCREPPDPGRRECARCAIASLRMVVDVASTAIFGCRWHIDRVPKVVDVPSTSPAGSDRAKYRPALAATRAKCRAARQRFRANVGLTWRPVDLGRWFTPVRDG